MRSSTADWATRVMIDLMPCIIPGCNMLEDRTLAAKIWMALEIVLEIYTDNGSIQNGAKEALVNVLIGASSRNPAKKAQIFAIGKAFEANVYKPLARNLDESLHEIAA